MQVTVPSFAKLNLDLRVLYKRPDGFHELRTIFQTISLKDSLTIEYRPQKRTQIEINSSIDIQDNIVVKATQTVLDALKATGWIRFSLTKRIPMGAGLGGGSSNAAAVLLALPALIGGRRKLPLTGLAHLAAKLGSDVPFFLYGGAAVGLGRGTELYPLPDLPAHPAVVVASGIHVSTAEAYGGLNRDVFTTHEALTSPVMSHILGEFQAVAWALGSSGLAGLTLRNDFEDSVFARHPELAALVKKLQRLGATPARMTGSGSTVFGVFASKTLAAQAAATLTGSKGLNVSAIPVQFVSRRRYRAAWRNALAAGEPHLAGNDLAGEWFF